MPLYLALGASVGALSSLGLGRLYDRVGLGVVLMAVVAAAAFSPFVFLLPVGLAVVGMVLLVQGFIGKEINPDGQPFAMPMDPDDPGIVHPPERHRGRLMVIGAGLMALAVVLGLMLL